MNIYNMSENTNSSEYKFNPSDLGNSTESMVDRFDIDVFKYALVSILSSIVPAVCISLFVTGELTFRAIGLYVGLTYLNVFSLALPSLGIIESQPLFVWYILASTWLSFAFIAAFIGYQVTGNLKVKNLKEFKSSIHKSVGWFAAIAFCTSVLGYMLEWSLTYMAEVYMVIMMNVFAFPIVFFTPLMEFNAPSWVIIAALWAYRLKMF